MKPKARDSEILVQEIRDEVLIYDQKINLGFSLNETCADATYQAICSIQANLHCSNLFAVLCAQI